MESSTQMREFGQAAEGLNWKLLHLDKWKEMSNLKFVCW